MSELAPVENAPIVRDFSLQRLVSLDAKVDKAEGEGLRVRWDFGRELLSRRVGKQLPAGYLDQVAEATGKSREELGRRMRFAESFPTEAELRHAVTNFGSWHRIVNEALSGLGVHYSSNTGEWETPQDLFDELASEFRFSLDVCATAENAKCSHYLTSDDDGLQAGWEGTCWMNPPYGDEIGAWVAKAHAEGQAGNTVVCLVPARTDTAWWWDFCRFGEVRFLRGRLRFGKASSGAPFPSAVVIFGPDAKQRVLHWERERAASA